MNITKWQQYTTVPFLREYDNVLNIYFQQVLKYIIEIRRSGALSPRLLLPLSLHLVSASGSLLVVRRLFLAFPPVPKGVGALPLWVSPDVVLDGLH
jgi:hypothetical protein